MVIGMPFSVLLSCLCGSEVADGPVQVKLSLLSCLCGSEGTPLGAMPYRQLLSCLCGSEGYR